MIASPYKIFRDNRVLTAAAASVATMFFAIHLSGNKASPDDSDHTSNNDDEVISCDDARPVSETPSEKKAKTELSHIADIFNEPIANIGSSLKGTFGLLDFHTIATINTLQSPINRENILLAVDRHRTSQTLISHITVPSQEQSPPIVSAEFQVPFGDQPYLENMMDVNMDARQDTAPNDGREYEDLDPFDSTSIPNYDITTRGRSGYG